MSHLIRHFARLALATLAFALWSNAAHAADEVKLVKVNSIYSGYKGPWLRGSFEVDVANLAFAKQVFIHYRKTDGSWGDLPLTYNRPATSGREIWSAYFSNTSGGSTLPGVADPIQFAVKYQVNGNTYWDNNAGANYSVAQNGGTILINRNVYNASWTPSIANTSSNNNLVTGYVTVKNIAPTKTVQVVYTLDNWATQNTVAATFSPYFWNSAYSSATNPNAYGFEEWNWAIPVGTTATTLKYAIKYIVNGTTYWDNNFGNDYVTTIVR